MKLALASKNDNKISALQAVFADVAGFELVTFKAPSGVNEQPVGEETFEGAANRIAFIRAACPDADLYISIENGLFVENGDYIDRAVVTITDKNGKTETTISDGVIFPAEYVEQARSREGGFAVWTAGKVMAEAGFISDEADPHIGISGKPRAAYIDEALVRAVAKLEL